MSKAIWQRTELSAFQFRLLWWLLDAGITSGEFRRGWIAVAALDLEVHRTTVTRNLAKLQRFGVLLLSDANIPSLSPDCLSSAVDESKVKKG